MTPQEKKEIVRSVIINAVPNFPSHISVWNKNDKTTEIDVISSRPITLADVLVAIIDRFAIGLGDGTFDLAMGSVYFKSKGKSFKWDLSQDFDHQSEAFYLFAWELLCE